jgi:drug/metabolite transporter (DMT)-like permease
MGYLLGSMLNPVVIVITLGSFVWLRKHPYGLRLVAALGTVAVAGIVLYSFDHYLTNDAKVRGLMFGLLSTAVWFAIFASASMLRRRQG